MMLDLGAFHSWGSHCEFPIPRGRDGKLAMTRAPELGHHSLIVGFEASAGLLAPTNNPPEGSIPELRPQREMHPGT
jgi:hypothetical protein